VDDGSPSYQSLKSSKESSSCPECHHATHQFFTLSKKLSDLKLLLFFDWIDPQKMERKKEEEKFNLF
jgi:hypothetical protein